MKKISFILAVLLIGSFFTLYSLYKSSEGTQDLQKVIETNHKINDTPSILNNLSEETTKPNERIYNGLHTLIGKTGDDILRLLGKPQRIDPSSFDYVWWIYKQNENSYLQVGVLDNKVVTIFAIGEGINIDPFYTNQTLSEIKMRFPVLETHHLYVENNSYRFELTDKEREVRPLFQFGEVWVQLYIDQFTNKLSSIRILDSLTLIKQRPYELVYRGELISPRELTKEEWHSVEKGSSLQILDITNFIRKRHKLNEVSWHEKTSNVAVLHSKDMKENNYFSHDSPTTGGLSERLKKGEIKYHLAGENIAAKYVDGIAAVEGWLNSKGHRETLLNEEFTHLGVGVFEQYFTQNFISTWEPPK